MFALAISLLSDALGGSQEVGSVLSFDPVFRREFQKQVWSSGISMPVFAFI